MTVWTERRNIPRIYRVFEEVVCGKLKNLVLIECQMSLILKMGDSLRLVLFFQKLNFNVGLGFVYGSLPENSQFLFELKNCQTVPLTNQKK